MSQSSAHAIDRSGVFVSYSRTDGAEFAKSLRLSLDAAGIKVNQDRVVLEGGRDWWLQLEAAIKDSRFLVLVMTPAAIRSEFVRKEWRLARQEGVCVYPIKAGSKADFDALIGTLPRWMRDMHFYDLGYDPADLEQGVEWGKLLADLRHDCVEKRVPFMVEDLPDDYVPRPAEFNDLISHLLDPARENPVAITAALKGAGGYGKTTLARALCHHEDIQQAFDDGVLWVTLGETPGDLTGRVLDLVATLTGARPAVNGLDAAKTELAKALADRDILIVIDDAWDSAHVKPFLSGGERCARLITTRDAGTLPPDAARVDVDAMRADEAVALLRAGLPDGEASQTAARLSALADRLGKWALLITLANGVLRNRAKKQPLAAALDYVEKGLKARGLTVFDDSKSEDRHKAVASTLGLSLSLLEADHLRRFAELAIFPEDSDIPLAALDRLWGTDDFDTEWLCEHLDSLSLLLRFDPNARTIRLHDVVRGFLRLSDKSPLSGGEKALPPVHGRFLEAYGVTRWADLPAAEPYLWDGLVYHLIEAGRLDELARTVKDLRYVARKTHQRDPYAAEADLTRAVKALPTDDALQTLKRQYGNMTHILPEQETEAEIMVWMHRRLVGFDVLASSCDALEAEIPRPFITAWRTLPDLPPPALIRTLTGHRSELTSCAVGDGVIVSASWDGTLKVWDLTTGAERLTLTGHTSGVTGCAVGDGVIVSASRDKTLKVWDLHTGRERFTLTGHTSEVTGCALGDGVIVSASEDKTLKVWDLATGSERFTLTGHTSWVRSCAVGDGMIVSASRDKTLKVWDAATGAERLTLTGHTSGVRGCALGDGVIVSASADNTLKVWDVQTGAERFTLTGHTGAVTSCAVGDGVIVSASLDKTLKLWDVQTGAEYFTLTGHAGWVNGCAVGDGVIVSASEDRTLKVWDAATGAERLTLTGHTGAVFGCAVGDGVIVSASEDRTLKVWDAATGAERLTLTGHTGAVFGCAVGDGVIVSASDDKMLKLWDLATAAARFTLTGHTDVVASCAVGDSVIVSASWDETIKVWDAEPAERFTLTGHRGAVTGCAVGDGVIVSASWDGTLKLWDLQMRAEYFTLTGHTSRVRSCAVGDGVIVSASSDKTLKVWDAATGALRFTLHGHRSEVSSCAVGAGVIISASEDRTLKVWDLHTGACLTTFHADGYLSSCALLPDGEHIVAGGEKGLYWLRLVR